jgi:hypothetical protein
MTEGAARNDGFPAASLGDACGLIGFAERIDSFGVTDPVEIGEAVGEKPAVAWLLDRPLT